MATGNQLRSASHIDLQKGISQPRFATFLHAAGGDAEVARNLYVWNRDLSVAILADIAILEVALRNAMHDAASAAWGTHWYADKAVVLDQRSEGQLASAWRLLPNSVKNRGDEPDVPGRVVAHCMFGFWTNLIDAAGFTSGREPRRYKVDYDALWLQAFRHAFPGGRVEAKAQRAPLIAALPNDAKRAAEVVRLKQEVAFTRTWVHSICQIVNQLRNRVAHHEPLINGFPLNGQRRRLTAEEGHENCRMLARMLDRDLAAWIDANTTVPALLQSRPQAAALAGATVPAPRPEQ